MILYNLQKAEVLHGFVLNRIMLSVNANFAVVASISGHFCQAAAILSVYSQEFTSMKLYLRKLEFCMRGVIDTRDVYIV